MNIFTLLIRKHRYTCMMYNVHIHDITYSYTITEYHACLL